MVREITHFMADAVQCYAFLSWVNMQRYALKIIISPDRTDDFGSERLHNELFHLLPSRQKSVCQQ